MLALTRTTLSGQQPSEIQTSCCLQETVTPTAATLTLLTPPVIEEGVVESVQKHFGGQEKARLFAKNSTQISAFLLFALKMGLLEKSKIESFSDLSESNQYSNLYDLYGQSLNALANFLNAKISAISGRDNPHQFLCLSTENRGDGTPVLEISAEPSACPIELTGDMEIDQMTNSLLILLSEDSFTLLPEDLLSLSGWIEEEGDCLLEIKKKLQTDNLEVIASHISDQPELYHSIALDLYSVDKEDILSHLQYLDDNYETIPKHLTYEGRISGTDIFTKLLIWNQEGDSRLNHPRVKAIKKGLLAFHKIQRQHRESHPTSMELCVNPSDVADGDYECFIHANCSQFIHYGLKFEELISQDLYQQMMEMGEESLLYFNLSPVAHSALRDKLLSIAETQGIVALLEASPSTFEE